MAAVSSVQDSSTSLRDVKFTGSVKTVGGHVYPFPYGDSAELVRKVNSFAVKGNAVFGIPDIRSTFDSVVFRKTEYILLVDVNPETQKFWDEIRDYLEFADTDRQKFIEFLKDLIYRDPKLFFSAHQTPDNIWEKIEEALEDPLFWLSSEAGFKKVQEIADRGNVKITNLDFFNPKDVDAYVETAKKVGVVFDIITVSNVFSYCKTQEDFEGFYGSFRVLQKQFPDAVVEHNVVNLSTTLAISATPLGEYRPHFSFHQMTVPLSEDMLDYHLSKGADPKELIKGFSTLHSCSDSLVVIQQLMKLGVHINSRSGKGNTPLNSAVQACRVGKVTSLLKAGARTDIADEAGFYPIHSAAENPERLPVLKVLLEDDPKLAKQKNRAGFLPEQMVEDEVTRMALKKARTKKKK